MARQMKDSGVEWIGQIPEDWDVARLCDIKSEKKFAIVDGPFGSAISTNDYREKGVPLIRISNLKNGEVSDEDMVYISEELAESVRRSCIGLSDIVFAKTGATIGKCGINRLIKYGILASSCIKISISHKYNCDYFYYIFSTDQFNQALRNTCTGTTRDTINLTPFSKLNVLLPPYCIQNRIASYLDRKCAEIDAIIAKQQQIIEKLKEYKLSVITEAVTKGLDPNVPMKDSGIDFIGSIPETWRICRLRNIGTLQNGISKGGEFFGHGFPFVSYGDVYRNFSLPVQVAGLIDSSDEERRNYSVESGDIFFTRTSETIEEVGFSSVCEETIPDATFAGFLIRVRPFTDDLMPKFAKYYFRSNHHRCYLGKQMNLVTRASLGQDLLKSMPVLVPSKVEQIGIAEYLDKKCSAIESSIEYKQRIIERLTAYKKSLIYESVTGKKEV
ncbi:hypothetical protein B5G12_03585 [Faecalibacterium sp. An58]|uniref:restriction endonuclease subunit S n=1 Tax=Faecalibacterium sp. An58 TaxID=1965648 RepID=UPI000B37C746|nr:restriction endonuclease subunit S [Faecalibacterium sp. An58]OUN75378.1 hypothetical protein B5G12_03585 [Faecalibacterium sp. An58]